MATLVNLDRPTESNLQFGNDQKGPFYVDEPCLSKSCDPALQAHEISRQHHDQIVSSLAAHVRAFSESGQRFRIYHGSSNSTRPPSTGNLLDVSALNNVLSISKGDENSGYESWCLVEPNVPMDKLVEATLPYGLVPPVVMEFPGITVGGGFSGSSAESSSFRCGFFSDNVHEVEMILGNGEIVQASNDHHQDLFHAAAGALGTLGIVTAVRLRLVPAKAFVHVRYTRLATFLPDAIGQFRKMKAGATFEYLDAILYSKQHAVAITGTSIHNDLPEGARIQTFSDAADEWFYRHVRQRTARLAPGTEADEYVPLAEFLFRYDRGGFWVGEMGYDYFHHLIPFNRFTRWLLDDFSHTRTLYHALHATGVTRELVVQDVTVPWDRAIELIDHLADDLDIWPLWLCPLGRARMPTFHPVTALSSLSSSATDTSPDGSEPAPSPPPSLSDEMLSIGVWGWGPRDRAAFIARNRGLEAKLEALGGRKWLYAHVFYSEDEFWRLYDRTWYEGLRDKYHATSLMSIYEKIGRSAAGDHDARGWLQTAREMWPVGGLVGMWRAVRSGDINLHRSAKWKWIAGS
ncbi:hypothetical protein C7999DRAFT_28801 [Corynascus novoguineensis]|uniref:Delta(24)-sterol reductase n=1 Tax=Corynascus novoguineensis TaxID=1126955 RepID=A0AAN7D161_9PEZI|nr:hypothetical protein C7999DRAFT_28801 [Corynascus novoguineensis]